LTTIAAASANSRPSSITATTCSEATAKSAIPPWRNSARQRWPMRSERTPGPTASITPATSIPGAKGRGGRTW
jgi:hypothetical protein